MSAALSVFVLLAGLELLLWPRPIWRHRQLLSRLFIGLIILSTAFLFITTPTFLVGLLAFLSVYRVVNLARVAVGRVSEPHLYSTSWRSAWYLMLSQLAVLFAWALLHSYSIGQGVFWYFVLAAQLAFAMMLLVTTLRHLSTTRPPKDVATLPTSKLPSLTVAVPARNETEQLEICLSSLIANDYPKLEILVLDDCSPNPRTPEIIRSYAHDGVRFIAGAEANEGWLPKNQAYERLAQESNGEIILFCGVDAHFEAGSLRRLVETLLYKQKTMISIMPRNLLPRNSRLLGLLVQPMRYAWEIALPRKLFKRPPVLSTCWIIKRTLLDSAGGFKAVARSIVPESYFARMAVVHDGYSFMQSNSDIGISCQKDIAEQHDTATRIKYPQLHRRPELVAWLTVSELMSLILPVVFVIASFAVPELRLLAALSGSTTTVLMAWYCIIVSLTYRRFSLVSLIALPFAVIHDVAVLNYSMLKYEFSRVLWKGRNVCIPVMRVEPRLPKAS